MTTASAWAPAEAHARRDLRRALARTFRAVARDEGADAATRQLAAVLAAYGLTEVVADVRPSGRVLVTATGDHGARWSAEGTPDGDLLRMTPLGEHTLRPRAELLRERDEIIRRADARRRTRARRLSRAAPRVRASHPPARRRACPTARRRSRGPDDPGPAGPGDHDQAGAAHLPVRRHGRRRRHP
jgi:hypothetical protein